MLWTSAPAEKRLKIPCQRAIHDHFFVSAQGGVRRERIRPLHSAQDDSIKGRALAVRAGVGTGPYRGGLGAGTLGRWKDGALAVRAGVGTGPYMGAWVQGRWAGGKTGRWR